jgi:hypothetical protein
MSDSRNDIERIKYNGYLIRIVADEDAEDPRKICDTFGTMVCFHRRYVLGDETEWTKRGARSRDEGRSVAEEFVEWLDDKENHVAVWLPLYLYDHSGITMSTGSFRYADPGGWDSGQVGRIFVTEEKIRENYLLAADAVISPEILEKAVSLMRAEVEEYDRYLTGGFVGFVIELADGTKLDSGSGDNSCWGFDDKAYAISEAKALVDWWVEEEKRCEQACAL